VDYERIFEGSQGKGTRCCGSGSPEKGDLKPLRGLPLDHQTLHLKRRREGEDLETRRSTGRKRRILATSEQKRALWEQLEENDEATLERHCELWEKEQGVRVSIATMSRAIRQKLGWTLEKGRWVSPSETKKREVLGESA
jgi:transposase